MSEVTNETVTALNQRLDDVDVALARLRDGAYRTCDVCGEAIDDELLVANALRTNCAAHPTLRD